jgi:hypothetical protein
LKKVISEIDRCKAYKCDYCGEKGAAIKCAVKKCNNEYHFLCARSTGCCLDYNKYLIYCKEHQLEFLENSEHEKGKELVKYQYEFNIDNVICYVCKSGQDEPNMLLCDLCNKGLHIYCNDPPILIPDNEWFCDDCKKRNK